MGSMYSSNYDLLKIISKSFS